MPDGPQAVMGGQHSLETLQNPLFPENSLPGERISLRRRIQAMGLHVIFLFQVGQTSSPQAFLLRSTFLRTLFQSVS